MRNSENCGRNEGLEQEWGKTTKSWELMDCSKVKGKQQIKQKSWNLSGDLE